MWFVGIDWADRYHEVVILNELGHQVDALRVAHSAAGLAALTTYLHSGSGHREVDGMTAPPVDLPADQPDQEQGQQVVCLVETDHGLLITALLEAGLTFCPVHPTTLKRLRPPSGVKTDRLDARLLARVGRNDWPNLRVVRPDAPLVQELKTLTRDLEGLLHAQTRLVNQLTACLKAYFPAALECFDGLTRQVSLAFLQAFPTPEVAAQASLAQLTAVLTRVHYPHPQHKAAQLQRLFQAPRLHAATGVAHAKARLMEALRAQLALLREQIAAFDQAIQQLFLQHADAPLFASLPGAGRRLAPRLLAEWGEDRSRFTSAASVQALAGTAPVLYQSGTFRGVRRRRACVNAFRQTLYQLARESVLCEPWARTYYRRKRAEGKTQAMALRALANHWVRILYAVWQKHERYDSEVFAQAQRAHGSPAAAAYPPRSRDRCGPRDGATNSARFGPERASRAQGVKAGRP
jgi:transposase